MSSIAVSGNDGNDGESLSWAQIVNGSDPSNPSNPSCENEGNGGNGGLANEQELELNEPAQKLMLDIFARLVGVSGGGVFNGEAFNGEAFSFDPEDMGNFKPIRSPKQLAQLQKIFSHIINCQRVIANILEDLKNKGKCEDKRGIAKTMGRVKKEYNMRLNAFLSILSETSPLRHLLFVNNNLKFVSKKSPHIKWREDLGDPFAGIVGGFKEGEDRTGFVLRVKGDLNVGGRRLHFVLPEDCLLAFKAMMDRCYSWNTHVVKYTGKQRRQQSVEPYGSFKLELNASSYDLYTLRMFIDNNHWIDASDPGLIHVLCGGNPPRNDDKCCRECPKSDTFRTVYPHLVEFLTCVKAQILKIIRYSIALADCPFTTIHCCRSEPVCNGETIVRKVVDGGYALRNCGLCHIELCGHGCGKIHHGDAPCEVSLDEASRTFIQETTVPCPQCLSNVEKTYGCNHMTCQCGCHFCWLCGVEMPRDEHGHYRTDLHFGVDGGGINGGCRQFN